MLTETFNARTIRYASVWEDADVLCGALAPVAQGGRLLSIASGGDNALALLTLDPAEVVAADLSAAQVACLELRVAAFRRLDYPELLAFLGVSPSRRRRVLYGRVRPALSDRARDFWDARPDLVERGVIHAGKFERYLRLFGCGLLPLIYGKDTCIKLLFRRSTPQQFAFYRQVWDRKAWRAVFMLFFGRTVLGRLGRDPALLRHVKVHVGRRLLARTRTALTRIPTWSNPYLTYIMRGTFNSEALPRYLRPEHFDAIRGRLDRLRPVCAAVQDCPGEFHGMNLSDLFEYLGPEEHRQVYGQLLERCRPGGRMVYWNLL
ncbi:MAG: DUF3419 family protein, partial [Candidatus Eremiobacterota bacterium]